MTVSPEFVLRGFATEPSSCCGCRVSLASSSSDRKFVVVGMADGSVEVWHIGTYRVVARSTGRLFASQSPVLCIREVKTPNSNQHEKSQAIILVESKVHEIAFFKLAADPNPNIIQPEFVQLYKLEVSSDFMAPSFCQLDALGFHNPRDSETSVVIARAGPESAIIISKFSFLAGNILAPGGKDIAIEVPASFGNKLGLPMFIKFVGQTAKNDSVLVCGYESANLLLWAASGDLSIPTLLDNFSLQRLLQETGKPDETDDLDMCPTCIDIVGCGGSSIAQTKPCSVFAIVGTTSNSIAKLTLHDDLTNFAGSKPQVLRLPSKGVTTMVTRPDRKLCAIGVSDGNIYLVSPKSFTLLGTLSFHRQTSIGNCTISALDFLETSHQPKSWLLAASSRDKTVSLWNIYNNNNN